MEEVCFGLPYAIGSAAIYYPIKQYIPNLQALEYPGHGCRIAEPCCNTIQDLAKDAYDQIEERLDKPYTILGYSMGCLVAYELYKLIKKNNVPKPLNIMLLASDTPGAKRTNKNFASMSSDELVNELKLLGGTDEAIFENEEIMDMLSPITRADLTAIEQYKDNDPIVLDVPTLVMRGMQEDALDKSIEAWDHYLGQRSYKCLVPGEHFFLFRNVKQSMRALRQARSCLRQSQAVNSRI